MSRPRSGQQDEPGTAHLYGDHTEAALANARVTGERVDQRVIVALAHVKAAAAEANATLLDDYPSALADVIAGAADQVVAGDHDGEFPVEVWQTGSGTSTNMNVNEVIAALASRSWPDPVHPNDHVNASQSTNDVFPTAMRIALATCIESDVVPSLESLEHELGLKARQWSAVVKAGRTHLMDASPVMVGHEIAGYRTQVHEAIARLRRSVDALVAVPLGGTATGNGLNSPDGYAAEAIAVLARRTGLALREVRDHFAAQGAQDDLVEASAQLRGAAIALFKIANDIRWSSSGPRAGLGELRLPERQPGSSIMPGKVNPVGCEIVLQIVAQVMGNDAAVAFAGTQGNHQLNTFLPVIARNTLESADLVAAAARTLVSAVVVPMEVDLETCRRHAEASPAVATALNLVLGYDAAAQVVRDALANDRSILEEVIESAALDPTEARRLLDPATMAAGVTMPFDGDLPGEDPDVPPSVLPPGETGVVGPGH